MTIPDELAIYPVAHPSLEAQRAGFPLDHPYLEQCWTSVLGPSSVLLLRHTTQLWRDQTPALVDTSDLSQQIGLGKGHGTSSPMARTLNRLVRFRFAEWAKPGVLDVYTEVRPLPDRHLRQAPAWTAARHDELLSRHLDALMNRTSSPAVDAVSDPVSVMAQRLDEFAATGATSTKGLGR